jgi:cytochrome c
MGPGMFDTLTMTKVVGAVCGAFLAFLLIGWAAESLYHGGHGHEGEQAYTIETGEDEPAEAAAEGPSFEELFASADAAAGEKLWRQCSACHALEAGKNGTGPYLVGVVGRDKGSVDGFKYSAALAEAEGAWEPANIDGFLANPKGYLPGTAMAYAGMKKAQDRANLIAYLATVTN